MKYASIMVATATVTTVLVFGVLLYSAKNNYDFLTTMGPTADVVKSQLRVHLMEMFRLLGIVGLFFIFSLFVIGIVISHKTAGPLHQYKRVLQALSEGDKKARLVTRNGDDFKDVAVLFNKVIDKIQTGSKA